MFDILIWFKKGRSVWFIFDILLSVEKTVGCGLIYFFSTFSVKKCLCRWFISILSIANS